LRDWNGGGVVDTNALKRQVIFHLKTRLEVELPEAADLPEFFRTAIPKLTGFDWNEDNLASIVEALEHINDREWATKTAWEAPEPVEAEEETRPGETEEVDEKPAHEPSEDELAAIESSL
jgi:hypothetical protein